MDGQIANLCSRENLFPRFFRFLHVATPGPLTRRGKEKFRFLQACQLPEHLYDSFRQGKNLRFLALPTAAGQSPYCCLEIEILPTSRKQLSFSATQRQDQREKVAPMATLFCAQGLQERDNLVRA
jgi:hypothetical protein